VWQNLVVRTIRYQAIADALRDSIRRGTLAPGRMLPSEAELSAQHGVSRVTIRRALDVLRAEGLLDARQGLGWFVASAPIRQSLGELGTIEEQLAASGSTPERRVLSFAFWRAPARVAEVLGADEVLEVRRLNLADGEPFAVVTVWCPASLAQRLSRADVERSPFYELLDVTIGGATQTIGAAAASAEEAELLGVPAGAPVLCCERVTEEQSGNAVLVSVHVFPAHRTEFVVHLARTAPSIAPTGLRLVE
jgi:GntR family transcriptional regulator